MNDLDTAEMENIREAVKGVYARHAEEIGTAVSEKMKAALDEIRGA